MTLQITTTTNVSSSMDSDSFMDHRDLWVSKILPFLGMGNYAFLGPVNKKVRELYLDYCESVQHYPPMETTDDNEQPTATGMDTFYNAELVETTVLFPVDPPNHEDGQRMAQLYTGMLEESSIPSTGTFYGSVFYNVSCANYWQIQADLDTSEVIWRVCRHSGFLWGHLELLKWARANVGPWHL
ncbi:hypothetical protein SEMRO_131_G062330.1 [Seminavis robusta]|uniref:Uncharacterized protein n=1 Tax=Seminavis robusta TaxID=568900 RepID=A0A9N8DI00_9STRA|nr:hypothetical protein SEMRO_131_G062330.1 [Seminavis robusta]|eukprot:Sro131_g062330.1 n/a (184) ;mRNA; f:68883-69617